MRRALLAALAVLSCTPLRLRAADFPPAVAVESMALELTHAEHGTLHVRLRVTNPAGVPGVITGLRFELFLAGQRFATGVTALAEPLPAGTPHLLEQRFALALQDRRDQGRGPAGAEAHLRGTVLVRFEGVDRGLPFVHRTWLEGAARLAAE